MADLVGQQIDQYRIDALLGKGGMGAVYRAYDLNLARGVALKVTHPHLSQQKRFRDRFMQEARAAARLKHPSIVDVYNFGVHDDVLYMVFAFLPGGSLGDYMRRLEAEGRSVALRETLTLLAQVAEALGYAHRQGVVHRDIKPDNVLLEKLSPEEAAGGGPQVRAVVTDFGLAKLLEGGIHTSTGTFMGTLPYMSPEQCLGESIDGRSDLYSLGVMLYQLTTGRLPFDIKTPTDAVVKHMKETPQPPSELNPNLPPKVDAIIRKAIAREPQDRFESGLQMARALRVAAGALSEEEVTRFAAPATVLVLATEIEAQPPPAPPSALENAAKTAAPGTEFQLVIAREGVAPAVRAMDELEYTVGRAENSDISLDASGVSREHVRIERTLNGWQVVDLGSTNGTYVEKNRLLAGVPEPWEAGRTLRVGPFFLRWHRAAESDEQGATSDAPATAADLHRQGSRVALVADPTTVTVEPGSSAPVTLRLLNQGVTVDHHAVGVEGIPAAWVTAPAEPIQLMPGRQESVQIQLHPPRETTTAAGRHAYQIVVHSGDGDSSATTADGQLVVPPFFTLDAELHPTQLEAGKACRLVLRNGGNAPLPLKVTARDPADALRFDIEGKEMTIPAGGERTATVTPRAADQPLMGSPRQMPFSVRATPVAQSSAALSQTLSASFTVHPRLPRWVPAVLAVVLIPLCLILSIAGGNAILGGDETPTVTSTSAVNDGGIAVQPGGVTVTPEGAGGVTPENGDGGTPENGDGVTPVTETPDEPTVDLTATAAYLDADEDGDGLSRREEEEAGTDPANADTDGDGLSDGDEVALGTSPVQSDTDGDGTPDGADEDPLNTPVPPTPTPPGGGAGVIAFASSEAGVDEILLLDVTSGQEQVLISNGISPIWSPDGTQLAFLRKRFGGSGDALYIGDILYVIDSDGNNLRQLTDGQERILFPVWSPNGQWILYQSGFIAPTSARFQLYRVNLDGEVQQLTDGDDGASNALAQYRPDGNEVLYASFQQSPFSGGLLASVALMGADGSANEILIPGPDWNDLLGIPAGNPQIFFVEDYDWSPDGSQVALLFLLSDATRNNHLCTLKLNDGTAICFSDLPDVRFDNVVWAPDGEQILFLAEDPNTFDRNLLTIDPGSGVTLQVTAGYDVSSAIWSPDGARIVFTADRDDDGALEIYWVRRNGTDLEQLSGDGAASGSLRWRP